MDYTPEQLRIITRIHKNDWVEEEWQDIQKKLHRQAQDGKYRAVIGYICPENIEKLRAVGFSVRSYPGSVLNCRTYEIDWSEDNG